VALLQKLCHENIVRHYEAGLHDGSIYCAMELVECGTLKDVLRVRGQLPWREAAEVALQLCRALEHAHAKGCIHRDLKPGNLYLSEDGLVKLGDLGLARDLNRARLTMEGQTVGTWRYMAPEQITGDANIDGRLDLYATGCMLFEMVAGRVPFDGHDFCTIFDQHLDSTPPRLDVVADDCPRALADLVDQLLQKKPSHRPQTAAEVAECLEAILASEAADESTRGDKQSLHHSLIRESTPNLTYRLRSGPVAGQRKPRWKAAAIAAAVLAAVGVIALLVGQGN
jgi:serine/threonine protein kinase